MRTLSKTTANNESKVRSLKIQPQYRDNDANRIIPELRLRGDWLAKLGFTPNSRVRVKTMEKQLIITLDE